MDAIAAAAGLEPLDVNALDLLVARLRSVAHLLRDLAAATRRASPPGWSGSGRRAHDAAVARAAALLIACATTLETASVTLGALSATLHAVQAEAAQARRIVSAGTTDALAALTSQLQPALAAFYDADRRAATLLVDAFLGPPLTQQSSSLALPLTYRATSLGADVTQPRRIPNDPVAVSLWWAGMPAVDRAALGATSRAGQLLAGRDGMPTSFRDAANRVRLAQALRSAQRDYASATGLGVRGLEGGLEVVRRELPWPLSWVAGRVEPLLTGAKRRLDALQKLTRALSRPGRELLEFDAAGDGRAVIASGDVDASANVAVLVPGMSVELNDISRLIGESDALVKTAGRATVVVAWLGYDTPNLLQVAGDGKAKQGAGELISFTRGVRVTASLRQRLTVIGHSYGTLVVGLAARQAPIADGVVLLASPGVEASSAAQLKVPARHVWAERAATDPIQAVFWPAELSHLLGLSQPLVFGPDPSAAAFGAEHFSVGGAYGHSGYFSAGSQSLANLGRVVSGRSTK